MLHSVRSRTLLMGMVVVLTLGLSVNPALGQSSELSQEVASLQVVGWLQDYLVQLWQGAFGPGATASSKEGGMMDPNGDSSPQAQRQRVVETTAAWRYLLTKEGGMMDPNGDQGPALRVLDRRAAGRAIGPATKEGGMMDPNG